ncbi:ras-like protein [Anaeramoeba flamelloides]|uniref:Ras-like protein n=1 Tax=Anaeramoeba flamelloides TaxID=1746091 RepID=A0AAV7ZPM7_9EUKA|nr:ras-like protein [Anaeramoeba flamelloides]
MSYQKPNLKYHIVVLGSGATGKSALTVQMCFNHFVEIYDPTIEDSYTSQNVIDEEVAYIEILDTAGQDEYSALRPTYIRSGDGFLIVYAINNQNSFDQVEMFRQEILRVKDSDNEPILLVGNKSDLEKERKISVTEREDLAKSMSCKSLETSAKTNHNVEKAFFEMVRLIRKKRQQKNKNTNISLKRKKKRKFRCHLM